MEAECAVSYSLGFGGATSASTSAVGSRREPCGWIISV